MSTPRPDLKSRKIAIALSGGGYRAATFHLGTLRSLAEAGLFEQVTFISSVSGGSLVTGLIYALNENRWPTSRQFLDSIYDRALEVLRTSNLEKGILLGLLRPDVWWFSGIASLTARALESQWGFKVKLKDLPEMPRWIINATTYETGKNFRFMPQRMGDYILGYTAYPDLPASAAVAASAGFPILIGPYILPTGSREWFKYSDPASKNKLSSKAAFNKLHLWDGGVYDNLGLEALYKPNRSEFREGFDFLVVSDGSLGIEPSTSRWRFSRAKRLLDIATAQARNLMVRSLHHHFSKNPYSGVFFQIGATSRGIVAMSPRASELRDLDHSIYLDEGKCAASSRIGSRLSPMKLECSEDLVRHGNEVAHLTLRCFCPEYFPWK